MSVNLYNFRQTIGDPARPYLFLVHIPEIGTDTVVTAMARTTKLPAATMATTEIPFQGMKLNLGTTPTFEEWTCSFLCDEAHELRRLFLKWYSLIYDVGTGLTGHSNSYKSDNVGIAQLSRNNIKVATINLVGAFPSVVGGIELNQDVGNGFELFDVTFKYDYYIYDNQFGNQTVTAPFVRTNNSSKIARGTKPAGGNFQPQ